MKEIILRPYQQEIILKTTRYLENENFAAISSAVGSGKTMMSRIITSCLKGINKVIIATPLLNIGKDFSETEDVRYLYFSSEIAGGCYVIKKDDFLFVDDKRFKTIINVLKSPYSQKPHIVTHHSLARLYHFNFNKNDVSGTLFIIDEAHHCSDIKDDETKIGKVIKQIIEHGGKVLYMSATPYRIFDDKPISILPENCKIATRTMGDQMRDGYSPNIITDFVKLKENSLIENGVSTFGGNGKVKFRDKRVINEYLNEIYTRWVDYNYPKSIITIPSGESAETARYVKQYFENKIFTDYVAKKRNRRNPVVLDAVGNDKNDIIRDIKLDRDNNGRTFDIVVACRRCDEGTDIPSASHMFSIGLVGNTRQMLQRAGRILRNKNDIPGYADYFGKEWIETSMMIYLLPFIGDVKDYEKQGGKILMHCILASESYQYYCDKVNFLDTLKGKIKIKISKDKQEKILDYIDQVTDSVEREKVSDEYQILIESKNGITPYQSIDKNNTAQMINGINSMNLTPKIVETVTNKMIKNLEFCPSEKSFNDNIKKIFEYLVEIFNKNHLKINFTEKVDSISYKLTGKNFKDWSNTFILSEQEQDEIDFKLIYEYYKKENKMPTHIL